MKRSDAEAVILYVVNMLTTIARNSISNVDADTISAFARQFIEGCLQNDQPHPNAPVDVYALHAKYAGRDLNSILYELEHAKLAINGLSSTLEATRWQYTTSQGKQSPVDIDAERYRWIKRNLHTDMLQDFITHGRQACAMLKHEDAEREFTVFIDGVRFRS